MGTTGLNEQPTTKGNGVIKFKAKRMTESGYALHVPGNGGENELIIITSWGQDFRTRLVIVAASVDGPVTVLHQGASRVPLHQVITTIGNVVRKWSMTGIKPTPEELAWLDNQREKLIDRIDKIWARKPSNVPDKKAA